MSDHASIPAGPSLDVRYPALDGVRGVAVIMVLIWHYLTCLVSNDAGSWAPFARRLFSTTASGVDLFFALSGFLIAGILLDKKGSAGYFRVFYLRRTCRIFPLYFLLLGLFLLLAGRLPLAGQSNEWLFHHPMPLWSYATFTQNLFMGIERTFGANWLGVTWSLAVEEQFYLILPFIILLVGKRKLIWIVAALFLSLPVLRWASPGFHNYTCLPWRADSLLAGVAAALLVRSESAKALFVTKRNALHVAGGILIGGQVLLIVFPGYPGIFGETIEAMCFGTLILILRLGTFPPLGRIFENGALRWMGTLSYGIYMFHQPMSGLMHGALRLQTPRIAGMADVAITIASAMATIILAWVSFRFFESPFLRFAHRFSYSQRGT